ncbi:MAG: Hsp20/alpha crystallin family protein [Halobacteriales archaeon]
MPFGRRDPFEEFEQLLSRLSEEFDAEQWPVGGGVAVDVADHGDRYVVTADLPGFGKDDIDVRLAGGTLYLDAERETEDEEADVDYLRRERRRESASRRVSLPEAVDESGVTARYDQGVLTVDLPKLAADDGTSIDID